MNSNSYSNQNIPIRVNLSLKDETLRLLIEMADDMGISIDDIVTSIAEDSVIDLKRFQQDLGTVFIPDKCSKQDLINSIE